MIEHRHHMPRCIEGALDPPDEEINHTGVDDELAVEEEFYQKEAEKIIVRSVDRHYGDSTQPRHQIRQIEAPLSRRFVGGDEERGPRLAGEVE